MICQYDQNILITSFTTLLQISEENISSDLVIYETSSYKAYLEPEKLA